MGTNRTVTNIAIYFNCTMPLWFQVSIIKISNNLKEHMKHGTLFWIRYKLFWKSIYSVSELEIGVLCKWTLAWKCLVWWQVSRKLLCGCLVFLMLQHQFKTSETGGNPVNKLACGSVSNHNRELQLQSDIMNLWYTLVLQVNTVCAKRVI